MASHSVFPPKNTMTLEGVILRLQRIIEQRTSNADFRVVETKNLREIMNALIAISRPKL